jgi:hypothetical protein
VNWWPFVLFLVAGVAATIAQKAYFDALSKHHDVSPDADIAQEIGAAPHRLPAIVADETSRRWKALLTRQTEQSLERQRLVACAAIGVALVAFALFATSPAR